jgi:hypothetical protein
MNNSTCTAVNDASLLETDLYHQNYDCESSHSHVVGGGGGGSGGGCGPRILATPENPNHNDPLLLSLLSRENHDGCMLFLQACQVFNRAVSIHSMALLPEGSSLFFDAKSTTSTSTTVPAPLMIQAKGLYQGALMILHRIVFF